MASSPSHTKRYNAYAYAANNPVTLTDPSGHNVADLIGDAAVVGAFVYALRVLSAVPQKLASLLPMARKLVSGLLTLGMMLIRQLLVLMILKTAMDASTVFDFALGRGLGLLQWVRMLKPVKGFFLVKWFFDACTKPLAGGSGCRLAAKLIPKLPKCFVKGVGEEAVELGVDTALGAFGLGGGTSFGKTDVTRFLAQSWLFAAVASAGEDRYTGSTGLPSMWVMTHRPATKGGHPHVLLGLRKVYGRYGRERAEGSPGARCARGRAGHGAGGGRRPLPLGAIPQRSQS